MKYWTYNPDDLRSGLQRVSINTERDVSRYDTSYDRQDGSEHPVIINGKNLFLKVYRTKEVAYECYKHSIEASIRRNEKKIKEVLDETLFLRSVLNNNIVV